MIVSKKQMQNIVEVMERTIHKDINIMDEKGCIIASTDPLRIGAFHAGAHEIISKGLDKFIICENEDYEGTKSGINLPIIIQDKIVGVVGITGEVDEVSVLGTIIKKMTEIMISDNYQSNQQQSFNNLRYHFISYLLLNEEEINDEEELILRGKILGIDVNLKRVISVLNPINNNENNIDVRDEIKKQKVYDNVINEIEKTLDKNSQEIVIQLGSRIVIFSSSEDINHIFQRVTNIKDNIKQKYNYILYAGIGNLASNKIEIQKSYREADMACNMATILKNQPIKVSTDILVETLLQTVPKSDRIKLLERVFMNYTMEDIKEWIILLRCFVENNGSINGTATNLCIHKNTLQYRLTKLKTITGYDARNIKDSIPLYLAMLIYEVDIDNKLIDTSF